MRVLWFAGLQKKDYHQPAFPFLARDMKLEKGDRLQ
jgi:hypothetical protein